MTRKPVTFNLLSLTYLLIAVSILLRIVLTEPWDRRESVFDHLTILNAMTVSLLLLNALFLWKSSGAVRWATPLSVLMVTVSGMASSFDQGGESLIEALGIAVGFLLVNLPLLQSPVRQALRHPERRWWRRAERKRIHIPIVLGGVSEARIKGMSYDLSQTGVFVPMDHFGEAGPPKWHKDREIPVHLRLSEELELKCYGRIVRQAEAKGTYPAGVGIEFVDLPFLHRRELKKFLESSPD